MIKWTYITNKDNSARYTLGKLDSKMFFFVGINPSIAKPDDLDRTVARVENFAFNNSYDGWLMVNVYPQRVTNPKDMHLEVDTKIHQEQIEVLNFTLKPQKRKEILENCLGLSNQTKNFITHIEPLVVLNLIELTIPDKPTSQNQKYVTTNTGKSVLASIKNRDKNDEVTN